MVSLPFYSVGKVDNPSLPAYSISCISISSSSTFFFCRQTLSLSLYSLNCLPNGVIYHPFNPKQGVWLGRQAAENSEMRVHDKVLENLSLKIVKKSFCMLNLSFEMFL